MKNIFLFILFIIGSFTSLNLIAHADEAPVFNPVGSLNIVYGTSSISYSGQKSHSMYFNFGGPMLTLISGPIAFGGSFFPSLKMILNPPAGVNSFTTTLGFGPWVSYHKFVISMPFYFPSTTATDVGIGIGYRF